jgi:hypothetical protein
MQINFDFKTLLKLIPFRYHQQELMCASIAIFAWVIYFSEIDSVAFIVATFFSIVTVLSVISNLVFDFILKQEQKQESLIEVASEHSLYQLIATQAAERKNRATYKLEDLTQIPYFNMTPLYRELMSKGETDDKILKIYSDDFDKEEQCLPPGSIITIKIKKKYYKALKKGDS